MKHPSERGSAIFMVFIAVALFGLLAYAFMQSSRTSTSMMTDEEAEAHAAKLVGYANDIAMAVKRLKLRGCNETQFNFANSIIKWPNGNLVYPDPNGTGSNPNAPSDGRCDIFRQAGGITPKLMPEVTDGINGGGGALGTPFMVLVQVQGVGTSAPELGLWMQGIDPKVCNAISKMVGTGDIAPVDNNNNWYQYVGSYSSPTYSMYGEENALLVGKNYFCAQQSSGGQQIFIYVLLPR